MPDLELLRSLKPPVEPVAPRVARRRRRRRRPVLLTAPVVAAVLLALVLTQDRQTFAEAAVKAAQASPRLLIDGWKVTRVDEWDAVNGEMTFERDGRTLELRWPADDTGKLERVSGKLYRYSGADDFVAQIGNAQLRGTRASVAAALPEIHRVGAEDWLKALPETAVEPRAQTQAIDDMLKGVPVPAGFTPPAADGRARDRYQLGARVVGAVVCAWIERYLHGDKSAAAQLDSSRSWPILQQMNAEGDYPEVVWQYADALNGRGNVPGGKLGLTVDGTYKDAFGC